MLKYKLYLKDIERAIRNIEDSIKNSDFNTFSNNLDMVDSNAMRIQIIGESLKNIPLSFWKSPQINIKAFIDFRNIISHAYFKINPVLLWDIIKNKIPLLKKGVEGILKEQNE